MPQNPFADVIRSTLFWMGFFTVAIFLFFAYGARPVFHALGLFLGFLGGPGLDGTGL